jgi:hypothetical protein
MDATTNGRNGQGTNGRAKRPTKAELAAAVARAEGAEAALAELRERLETAEARAGEAESALLARPATATPPSGGHCTEALWPVTPKRIKVWVFAKPERPGEPDEAYRLRLIHVGPDGAGWEWIKHSDGTRYHMSQADGEDIFCDCPGCTAHGPRCDGGKGCKHAQFLRALRQMVDPGL